MLSHSGAGNGFRNNLAPSIPFQFPKLKPINNDNNKTKENQNLICLATAMLDTCLCNQAVPWRLNRER